MSRSLFRCPRCGKGKLFKGLLTVAERCGECGLSFAGHEQGDGPAFFAILIIGTLAAVGATIVEIRYEPPFWLHAVIWGPFVVIGTLWSLRFLKAALISVQYRVRKQDF
ncbi:MAG: DUF983 domain-containing protein [Pseudomonadota bacterium]|nr:DUF983 domain-containing protein [Pseudomonadota bacterium]